MFPWKHLTEVAHYKRPEIIKCSLESLPFASLGVSESLIAHFKPIREDVHRSLQRNVNGINCGMSQQRWVPQYKNRTRSNMKEFLNYLITVLSKHHNF